jgi:hypothetical protein
MQASLVECGGGDVRGIDHLRFAFVGEPDQSVINVLRQMMFAVHVEQRAGPELAFGKQIAERLDPDRFHEEKVQSLLGAMLLDSMDEQIIRVQLVRHHQIINARHGSEYLAGRRALSMAGQSSMRVARFQPSIVYWTVFLRLQTH